METKLKRIVLYTIYMMGNAKFEIKAFLIGFETFNLNAYKYRPHMCLLRKIATLKKITSFIQITINCATTMHLR